jgi:hypothetical protein
MEFVSGRHRQPRIYRAIELGGTKGPSDFVPVPLRRALAWCSHAGERHGYQHCFDILEGFEGDKDGAATARTSTAGATPACRGSAPEYRHSGYRHSGGGRNPC